jgi:hypothetical protein
MKTHASILAIAAVTLLAVAAELRPIPYADNLRDGVGKPSDQQDDFTKKEAEKLAKSQVPTAEEAAKLALGAFLKKPGVDARESWRVVGLYRIGRDVTDFAKAEDLVWEIHITRMASGVSGVVWVSTTTQSAKVLFP